MSVRQCGAGIPLAMLLVASLASEVRGQWTVTITPTLDPLPIGLCAAVQVRLVDQRGQQPRNLAGYLVGLADFDMSVTSPDPRAVVGQQIDPSHWSVCGCQAGVAKAVATITASYPARRLTARERVAGVVFQTTATFTLAAAKGAVDPPGCAGAATIATLPNTPLPPAPTKTVAPPATPQPPPVQPPVALAKPGAPAPKALAAGAPPTGVVVSGTPLIAQVTWAAAPGATRHAVLRQDGTQPSVEKSPAGFTAIQFTDTVPDPRPTYLYTVVAHYPDGTSGAAPAVQFISPPLVNPTGFTMTRKGQTSTQAAMEFSWNPVPGAVQYRLDGPGAPATGHHSTTTTTTLPAVPRGAGSWKVTALYPGNFADYPGATTLSQVIRILPTHSQPWLQKPNGKGSEVQAQMPYEYQPSCDPLGLFCNFESDPPSPLMPSYDKTRAGRMGTGLQKFAAPYPFGSPTKLGLWLAVNLNLWDDPDQPANEAVYGNPGDLGVGRRSDCAQSVKGGSMPGTHTVCYASAHGIPPGQPGFNDASLITRPGNNQDRLLTMVIKKDPSGSVFMVFTPAENFTQSPSVALDNEGDKYVPHMCLACHGGIYNPTTRKVDGASFLPIDPGLQAFSSPAEKAKQEFNIRRINAIIAKSGSSAAVVAYINGLYGNAVSIPHQQATPNYVPPGWQSNAGLYRTVVKPYCAMCHLAASSDLSFTSWSNFQSNAGRINAAVCGAHTMPHSELQFKEFWLKDTGPVYLPGMLAASLGYPSC